MIIKGKNKKQTFKDLCAGKWFIVNNDSIDILYYSIKEIKTSKVCYNSIALVEAHDSRYMMELVFITPDCEITPITVDLIDAKVR